MNIKKFSDMAPKDLHLVSEALTLKSFYTDNDEDENWMLNLANIFEKLKKESPLDGKRQVTILVEGGVVQAVHGLEEGETYQVIESEEKDEDEIGEEIGEEATIVITMFQGVVDDVFSTNEEIEEKVYDLDVE